MRLIDADALFTTMKQEWLDDLGIVDVLCVIDAMPTIDAVEVKHGRDIFREAKGHCEFKCSVCGVEIGIVEGGELDGGNFNYCPNCGAKMDGEIRND